MMRTEVKIGISVAILLAVVVVGYVVLNRGGDKPAGNEGDKSVAKANSPSPFIFGNSASTENRPGNTSPSPWGGTGASNNAANNAGGRTNIWDTGGTTSSYNGANAASNVANNAGWGTYNGAYNGGSWNTANNAASNGVAANTSRNVAANNSVSVDWGNSGIWNANTATNGTDSRTGTGGSGTATADQARTYTVKSGDTFSSIAKEMYGDAKHFQRLVDANKDINPNVMPVGAVVKVPPLPQASTGTGQAVTGGAGATATAGGSKKYVVVAGDTLWGIAGRMSGGGTREEKSAAIMKANLGMDPQNLKIGQEIILPDNATVSANTGTNTSANTPRTTTANRPAANTETGPNRPRFR